MPYKLKNQEFLMNPIDDKFCSNLFLDSESSLSLTTYLFFTIPWINSSYETALVVKPGQKYSKVAIYLLYFVKPTSLKSLWINSAIAKISKIITYSGILVAKLADQHLVSNSEGLNWVRPLTKLWDKFLNHTEAVNNLLNGVNNFIFFYLTLYKPILRLIFRRCQPTDKLR